MINIMPLEIKFETYFKTLQENSQKSQKPGEKTKSRFQVDFDARQSFVVVECSA